MPRPLLPRLLAAAAPPGEAASDADLLRRFTRGGDAAAFELVARRHAAAVWAACRRILPEADAEDAFQAAFLVLARKALAVRGTCAGGWLHRVAVTAALKRKASNRRHPAAGEPGIDTAGRDPPPSETLLQAELAAAVHEELARLPDRYRLPVVLCDLEGETQPAAAARLGWPVGSVAGRLSRARALLRDRLARRGFAPAGSVLVLPLVAVPGRVVSAAVAAATGAVVPSPPVSLLASGVLTAMRIAKLKLTAGLVAAACLVGAGGFGAYSATAQPPATTPDRPAGQPPAPAAERRVVTAEDGAVTAFPELTPKGLEDLVTNCPRLFGPVSEPAVDSNDALRHLQVARVNAARDGLKLHLARWQTGRFEGSSTAEVVALVTRAAEAAADLHTGRNGTVDVPRLRPWFEERVRVAKWQELVVAARVQAGAVPADAVVVARMSRLDAEIALLRLERGQPNNRAP